MAIAGIAFDAQPSRDFYFELVARADGTAETIEIVRAYLASWSPERIARVQRIDAGWAPFDPRQRPVPVDGALDVRCIRDAIHCHCMALTEAGVDLTLELLELDGFFFAACEAVENLGRLAIQVEAPAAIRALAVHSRPIALLHG